MKTWYNVLTDEHEEVTNLFWAFQYLINDAYRRGKRYGQTHTPNSRSYGKINSSDGMIDNEPVNLMTPERLEALDLIYSIKHPKKLSPQWSDWYTTLYNSMINNPPEEIK